MANDPRHGLPSASFLPILSKCRGSWQMVKNLPSETTAAAEIGQQVHDLASGELEEMGATERASYIWKAYETVWTKLAKEIYGDLENLMTYKETRFYLHDKDGNIVFSGQADKIVIRDGIALITDLKALTGQVDPSDENWQLLGLAIPFVDDDKTRGDYAVQTVYAAIIQPLVSRTPVVVKYDLAQLLVGRRQLIRLLEEAQSAAQSLTPGTHCRLCRARAHCHAALSLPMLWTKPETNVSTLTASDIAQLYPKLAAVESIIEAIRGRARELAATDPEFPYELKETQGKLKITNFKKARTFLQPHVTAEEFNSFLNIAIGELRELWVTRYAGVERTTKVEAGKKFLERLETASERGAPIKKLAKRKEQV